MEPLRERIRTLLREGELSREREARLGVGPSADANSSACGEVIPRGDTEFELEFRPGAPDTVICRFRRICSAVWECERTSQTT
jgi:hypothetical protein